MSTREDEVKKESFFIKIYMCIIEKILKFHCFISVLVKHCFGGYMLVRLMENLL